MSWVHTLERFIYNMQLKRRFKKLKYPIIMCQGCG